MISVCCCAINAKWDVQNFVECIIEQNKNVDFEIVLTHDNRVNDGARELYTELGATYPQFRCIEHSLQDTIDWLDWLMEEYEWRQRWDGNFRQWLNIQVKKYKRGELVNPTKEFLWISSGILYNKAIMEAKGDLLLVTPADFLLLFGLKDLEGYCRPLIQDGYLYTKPNAIWARISNSPKNWLEEEINRVCDNENLERLTERWRGENIFRDYLRYPTKPKDLYLADFRNRNMISMTDPDFLLKAEVYCKQCFENMNDQKIGPPFHGVHVMTKKSWEKIGGFTEEYYGRAFADDKMTRKGILHGTSFPGVEQALPSRFSIAWVGQGEYLPSRLSYYEGVNTLDLLSKVDPYWEDHPIPGMSGTVYLHDRYPSKLAQELNRQLSVFVYEDPIRFTGR